MSAKGLTLEEGLQEAIMRIDSFKERPILVAVYGWDGKSYFINLLEKHFREKGFRAHGSDGAPNMFEFFNLRDNPQQFPDMRIYHCGWELSDFTEFGCFGHEDPNSLAQEIVGRKVNLNIGIYNPLISRYPRGDYDILIANLGGKKKV
jgi:hypothetical protein